MKMSVTSAAITAVSAAFLLAQPLQAAAPEGNSSVAAAEQGGSPAARKAGKETRYCLLLEPGTGSRISTKRCKTKAEWAEEGIDPTNLK